MICQFKNRIGIAIQLSIFLSFVIQNSALASSAAEAHRAACIELLAPAGGALTGASDATLAFSSRLKALPEAEVAKRLGGRSISELTGFSRNSSGQLIAVFEKRRFFSVRDNLPMGFLGDTGWNAQRETRLLSLEPLQPRSLTPHMGPLAQTLPAALQNLFQTQTLVTQASYDSTSEYQILMHTAPKKDGPTGGRTGILLHNKLPIIVRDEVTGHEYLVELKGAGSVVGGYQPDKVVDAGYGKRGGTWGAVGGAYEIAARREHYTTNNFAFNILQKPEDSVLSMGYVAFEQLGQQALTLRLSPGNLRASYVFNDEALPTEVTARYTKQMSSLILKALLAGFVPMTHPENFVGSASDPQLHMIDFSDMLPYSRFPVNWGFEWRKLKETILISMSSIEQTSGFVESSNLDDIKAGFLNALSESSLDNLKARQVIEQALDMSQLVDAIYEHILIRVQSQSESAHGRLPQWMFSLSEQVNELMGRTPEQIERQVRTVAKKYSGLNINATTTELTSYPISKAKDSFTYRMDQITEAVMYPLVYQALRDRQLSAEDALDSVRLEKFIEGLLNQKENFIWSHVQDRLGSNKYAADIKEALNVSPTNLANKIRAHIATYSSVYSQEHKGSVPGLQTTVIATLRQEIKDLLKIAKYSEAANAAAIELQSRLAILQSLHPYEFANRFLQTHGELYRFMTVPYYQIEKYRNNPQYDVANVKEVIDSI